MSVLVASDSVSVFWFDCPGSFQFFDFILRKKQIKWLGFDLNDLASYALLLSVGIEVFFLANGYIANACLL